MYLFLTATYDVQVGREQPLSRERSRGLNDVVFAVQHIQRFRNSSIVVVVAGRHIPRPHFSLVVVEVDQREAAPVRVCCIVSFHIKIAIIVNGNGGTASPLSSDSTSRVTRANGQDHGDAPISVRALKISSTTVRARHVAASLFVLISCSVIHNSFPARYLLPYVSALLVVRAPARPLLAGGGGCFCP